MRAHDGGVPLNPPGGPPLLGRSTGKAGISEGRPLDVLLVNPPSPDGGVWIRSQHRVGRRSREGMIWPQCSLAQLAAMLHPQYTVEIVDAIAEAMSWAQFTSLLRRKRPRYYLTHVTAPTLSNDMYGVMQARSLGSRTIAFGLHVTPLPVETLRDFPALDFVLKGEPELTLRELLDNLEGRGDALPPSLEQSFLRTDPAWRGVASRGSGAQDPEDLSHITGLVWRYRGEIRVNRDRPLLPDLDSLPVPLYERLPLEKYRMPLIKGPFAFVLTSRGCPAACRFCIKHVVYRSTVRLLSPDRIIDEIGLLRDLGVSNMHMYADLFTVNREQVMKLCRRLIETGWKVRWTCNSRVDSVDDEMLGLMAQAGCWLISWGIESGSRSILRRARKGTNPSTVSQALLASRKAGIKNWGYFMIGLPGETVDTIRETIDFSKRLPLDIALFHIAAPHPGTPLFSEAVENGWLLPGTTWEDIDMDKGAVLQYEDLSAEEMVYWQRRAFREWAFRPGPLWTYAKMLLGDMRTAGRALSVGVEHLGWTVKR